MQRIIPEYKDKKSYLNGYITEEISKIKILLTISFENFKISENDKRIFKNK
ncbi:MAG: hypothetical protein QXI08_04945 [Thermoplasmata archaeon]